MPRAGDNPEKNAEVEPDETKLSVESQSDFQVYEEKGKKVEVDSQYLTN